MKRNEFISRLAQLLNRLPESERREAIQYYEDYFADAGVENEDEVVESLGTPEAVAASILQDFDGKDGSFTEHGYEEAELKKEVPVKVAGQSTSQSSNAGSQAGNTTKKKDGMEPWAIALIIIGIIITSPIWIALIGSIIGVAISIISTVFGIILAFAAIGLLLIGFGISLAIFGFSNLLSMPMGALSLVGVAIFLVGLGILSWFLTGWLVGTCLPFIFRQIIRFFKWIGRGCRKEAIA